MRTLGSLLKPAVKFFDFHPAVHLGCVVIGFFGFLLCTLPPIANGFAAQNPISQLLVALFLGLFFIGISALYGRAAHSLPAARSLRRD